MYGNKLLYRNCDFESYIFSQCKNWSKNVYALIHIGRHYCYIRVIARSCVLVWEVNFFLLPFFKFHNSWLETFSHSAMKIAIDNNC